MTTCPSGSDTDGQVKVAFDREPTRLQARVDHAPQAAQYYSDELAGYTYLVSSPGHHQALPDKRETYAVEADTAELRHYLARLARRSRCFTRAIGALRTAIKLFVYAWNRLESSGIVANPTVAPIPGTRPTSLPLYTRNCSHSPERPRLTGWGCEAYGNGGRVRAVTGHSWSNVLRTNGGCLDVVLIQGGGNGAAPRRQVSVSTDAPLSQRTDMVVFLNGEFVPGDQARIGVLTHGFSYGTGCFEGIRGYWNPETEDVYLFRARAHYERLHRSCRIMNIALPYSVDELLEINRELARRNGFRENCYFRPYAYKADELIGVRLHDLRDDFVMIGSPMGMYVRTDGLRCTVSSWRRVDDNAIPARAKIAGAYVNSALAKTDAQRSGFDEAIMLTSEGHVSEGSAENIFLVKGHELITPPPSENILLGVTRDTVMHLAERELGMTTHQRIIDRTELYVVDEIFLTGTACEIAPVVEVDHRAVGAGEIGPVSAQIQRIYGEVVRGMRSEYSEWTTPVYGKVGAAHDKVSRVLAAAGAGTTATNGTNGRAKHGANGHSSNGSNGRGANGHTRTRKPRPAAAAGAE